MPKLPLTTHEINLLKQIDQEVSDLSRIASDLFNQMDNEPDSNKQEELFKRGLSTSRIIRERSKIREGIFKAGIDRIQGKF